MSGLRAWLLGMVSAALALSLARSLTPPGAVEKIGRLIGGGVLLLAVLRPFFALDLGDLAGESVPAGAYGSEAVAGAERGTEVLSAVIAERSEAYIAERAGELGLACQAEVAVEVDENGWPIPAAVTLWGAWSQSEREELSRLLEEELGIPVARQAFEEEKGGEVG